MASGIEDSLKSIAGSSRRTASLEEPDLAVVDVMPAAIVSATDIHASKETRPNIPDLELTPGTFVDCLVTVVNSPAEFFAQPLIFEHAIKMLNKALQRFYPVLSAGELDISMEFYHKSGGYCVAKYGEDNCWYRALFLKRSSPTRGEVLFIDYGNVDEVLLSDCKVLVQKFSVERIRPLAITCVDVNADRIDAPRYKDMIEGAKVVLKIDNADDEAEVIVEVFLIGKGADAGKEFNVSRELTI